MSGSYEAPFWGQIGGAPQPAAYGIHPVYTPPPPPPSPNGAPPTADEIREAFYQASCQSSADCTFLSEPMPYVHPGFRHRVEEPSGRLVVRSAAANLDAAVELADAEGTGQVTIITGSKVFADPAGARTIAIFSVPTGRMAVVRAFSAEVLHGDPAEVTWALSVTGATPSGGGGQFTGRIIREPAFETELSTFILVGSEQAVVLAATPAAASVSPYLVQASMRLWVMSVQGRAGDSIETTLLRSGRGRDRLGRY